MFQTTTQLYSPIINHYQPLLIMIHQDYPIHEMENNQIIYIYVYIYIYNSINGDSMVINSG